MSFCLQEYSLGNLKEQVRDLVERNSDLDKYKDDAAKYLPADITQSLWPQVSRSLLSQWSFEIFYRRSLLKFGRQKHVEGVKYDSKKDAWSATVMIGKSRYGLGEFKSETAAQGAIDREIRAAERLGYGEVMTGSCESKLKATFLKIHEVMLDSRDLDTSTATLRQRISAAHDRNRVLERWSELSHAALHWLASPLLGSMRDMPVVRSSRISNPVVIRVIDEWKDNLQAQLDGKTQVPKKELVFAPVPAPCTPEYIKEHKAKKTYIKVGASLSFYSYVLTHLSISAVSTRVQNPGDPSEREGAAWQPARPSPPQLHTLCPHTQGQSCITHCESFQLLTADILIYSACRRVVRVLQKC